MTKTHDPRQFSPAAERNREPILQVLRRHLPPTGLVLEIASGTGQHVAHFAASLSELEWQPSDLSADCHPSISTWVKETRLANVRAPIKLDVTADTWPVEQAEAIVCINMIHISPWAATVGLLRGAARLLPQGGVLYLYGPYKRGGQHTAPSNADFDASLKARNPEWGVRNLEDVQSLARTHGFECVEVVEMPANNLSVVLRRA